MICICSDELSLMCADPTELNELLNLFYVVIGARRVATGRNRDDGRSYFAGFWLRHQRIGTRFV